MRAAGLRVVGVQGAIIDEAPWVYPFMKHQRNTGRSYK
jgi:hypothetical protein